MSAARKLLAYLEQSDRADATAAKQLMDAARLLVFLKGDDAHDYKFSSAVLEDYYHVSPDWRNQVPGRESFQDAKLCGPRQSPRRADAGRA